MQEPNYLGCAALVNTDALLGVSTLNCTALFAKQSVMQQHARTGESEHLVLTVERRRPQLAGVLVALLPRNLLTSCLPNH